MTLLTAFAIYFIIWWLTLFAVLPFGVRTQQEEGNVAPGTVPSAPARFRVWRTVFMTTVVSLIIFGVLYANTVFQWVSLEDVLGERPNW